MARKFGNLETQHLHDRLHGAPKAPLAEKAPEIREELREGENESPESVVAEHGKAHEVHVEHDHEGGEHKVNSKHPDGHEHHSRHSSAKEAHEHGAALAGANEDEEQNAAAAEDETGHPPFPTLGE